MNPMQPLGRGGGPVRRGDMRNPLGGTAERQLLGQPSPADPFGGGEWFAVEITSISTAPPTVTAANARYSFKEIQTVPGTTPPGPGGTEERTSARTADKDVNPARSLDSSVMFSVGQKALARRAVSDVNAFELVPVGAGGAWRAGYVTARSGASPPYVYEVQPVKLDSGGLYVADGDPVTPCYRMPSALYDEPDLLPIPSDEGGQGVLWRPDPNEAGKYQMTPWGGVWKVIKKELIFTCTRCEETSPGVFENVTNNVYRFLAHFGRDFRVTWKEAGATEGPIEDDLFETP